MWPGFLIFALLIPVFFARPVLSQDLRNEAPAKLILEWKHLSGLGPVVLECWRTEKGWLRCRSDRHLKSVQCVQSTSLNIQSEATLLRAKVSAEQFVCEPRFQESLTSRYLVSLLSEDGGYSEYLVNVASQEQVEALYREEMNYIRQKPAPYNRLELKGVGEFYAGSNQTGFAAEADFLKGIFTTFRYYKGGDLALGREWAIGARWEFLGGTPRSHRPFLFFDAGVGQRSSSDFGFSAIGTGLRSDWLGRWFSSVLRLQILYPRVNRLRSAYRIDGEWVMGPFFSRRLGWAAYVFYLDENWSKSAQEWQSRGLGFGARLSLNFGEER